MFAEDVNGSLDLQPLQVLTIKLLQLQELKKIRTQLKISALVSEQSIFGAILKPFHLCICISLSDGSTLIS